MTSRLIEIQIRIHYKQVPLVKGSMNVLHIFKIEGDRSMGKCEKT